MARVICAGHVNWDVTLHVDGLPAPDGEARVREVTAAGGGSAANVACALASLGVEAGLVGSVGGDSHGTEARHELAAAGVETTHLQVAPDRPTAVKYIAVDDAGEVMVFGIPGANEAYDAAAVAEGAFAAADHLHLTGQSPATAAGLADRARAAGLTVSVDPGRQVGKRDVVPVLSRADVVFLNDREARAVGDGVEGVVVRKRGAAGADLRADGERHAHPGFPAETVDTTGAGDAFAAGFLAASLGDADHEEALVVANACGALATESYGARADLSWAAVEAVRARGLAGDAPDADADD
jgi:ribokinase